MAGEDLFDGEALADVLGGAEIPEGVEVVIRRARDPGQLFVGGEGLVPGNTYRRVTFAISEAEGGWTPPGFVPEAGLKPWAAGLYECYVDGNTDTVGWGGPDWPEGVELCTVGEVFTPQPEPIDDFSCHIVADGSAVEVDDLPSFMRVGLGADAAASRRCAYVASDGEDMVPDGMLRGFDIVRGPGIKETARHDPAQPPGWFFATAPWEAVDNVPMPPPPAPGRPRVYCFTGAVLGARLRDRMVDAALRQQLASVRLMPDGSFALPGDAAADANADANADAS